MKIKDYVALGILMFVGVAAVFTAVNVYEGIKKTQAENEYTDFVNDRRDNPVTIPPEYAEQKLPGIDRSEVPAVCFESSGPGADTQEIFNLLTEQQSARCSYFISLYNLRLDAEERN